MKLEDLKKLSSNDVVTFKIRNRKGYAAVCMDNLTEGTSEQMALERMGKALKRMGYLLQ